MTTSISIADIVLLKVEEFSMSDIKNHIAINRYLPESVPKSYGHTFITSIHRYVLLKNHKDRICTIYTPRIGVVKAIKFSGSTRDGATYAVSWQERDERDFSGMIKSENEISYYWPENLIPMKSIDRFLTVKEFEQHCFQYHELQMNNVSGKTK